MNDVTMTVEHSEQLGALAKALAAAQGEFEDAKKDSKNPHFKNTYASLASVRAATTPVLSKHGLAVLQAFEPHGDAGPCIVTWLLHESGQWIRSRLFIPASKKDAQGFGSAITYGRRYSWQAITGIAADDDDDAEAAVGKRPPVQAAPVPAMQSEAAVSAEAAFGRRLDEVADSGELAKIHKEVGAAVQAGILDDKARGRLREKSQSAIKRLGTPANGTAA
jgi:hypothetical protein